MRLIGCHTYVDRRGGYSPGAGSTSVMLHSTPLGRSWESCSRLCVRQPPAGRCLVHNWSRLAHHVQDRMALQQRIAQAGGYSATTFDESDQRVHEDLAGCRRV
jgi:hypothetical protein